MSEVVRGISMLNRIPGSENEADIFTKTLMDLSSNAMQSFFLVKERSAVRGVTLSKGGV